MKNTFLTSDTHYHHANIIRYCNRPYKSVEHMNEKLIENWNSVVQPEDTVYHMGDFCFSTYDKAQEIFPRLNGRVILVKGNHDRQTQKMLDLGFIEVHESIKNIELGGMRFNMSHYPYKEYYSESDDREYLVNKCISDDGLWLLCGHIHEKWKINRKMFNVGVDVNELTPIHVDDVVSQIRKVGYEG